MNKINNGTLKNIWIYPMKQVILDWWQGNGTLSIIDQTQIMI